MFQKEFCGSKGAAKPYVRAEVGPALYWGKEATELGDQWDMGE